MFLKSAPPAVAIHSDWRSVSSLSSVGGGAPQSLGLPLCFNDSDSSLTSTSSPIRHKVQMIIETLRSTQSSVDIGDGGQMEGSGSVHSNHELLRQQGRRLKTGPCSSRSGVVTDTRTLMLHPHKDPVSQDSNSDSDSSVDRGIEEAIQEYLKEKGDPKHKAEPSFVSSSPAAKPQRLEPTVSSEDPVVQSGSDSTKVLKASNNIFKNLKQSVHPTTNPKNRLKRKRPCYGSPVKKTASTMLSFFKKRPSFDQGGASSSVLLHQDKAQPPLVVQAEAKPLDASSSSDDGIEEEIQRYQQQKKNQELLQLSQPLSTPLREDSESSSDDGIEEAIRRFQQEKKEREKLRKKKKKIKGKQTQPKNMPPPAKVDPCEIRKMDSVPSKKTTKSAHSGKVRKIKKRKMEERTFKPGLSPNLPTSVSSLSSDSFSSRANDAPSIKSKPSQEPVLKVNTTAELMCAEAILDISKAVMPVAFDPSPSPLAATGLTPAMGQPQLSSMDPSDGESSVDSEEGIELEIRKFLEHKAQMQKEMQAAPVTVDESPTATPNRPSAVIESDRGAHSDDKSSSFDSDEDLDAAIKDLLKTKKKVKKKVRKLPAKLTGTSSLASPSPKKHKRPANVRLKTAKPSHIKGTKKKMSTVKSNSHKTLKKAQDIKQEQKDKLQEEKVDPPKLDLTVGVYAPDGDADKEEDSSCIDSDDSIEQEIRKFLAEKAKVGGAHISPAANISSTPAITVKAEVVKQEIEHQVECSNKSTSPHRPIKPEDQQAEIPLELGGVCLDAQEGPLKNLENIAVERPTPEEHLSQGRDFLNLTHPAQKRKLSEERRRSDLISVCGDRPHTNSDTPNSKHQQTHTLEHIPNRTYTHMHLSNKTLSSRQHSTHRTLFQPSSSPNEIPSSQTLPSPALTSDLTPTCLPVISQSRHSTAVDSCGWTAVRPASLPVVAFYHSSGESPVGTDCQAAHRGPSNLLQGGGKRGRWDQPPGLMSQSSCKGSSQKTLWLQSGHSSQWGNHTAVGGKQERGMMEEERQLEVREVKREEETECVDETDLDSEEEKVEERRRSGERQTECRNLRFPNVSLKPSIDPGSLPSPYIILTTAERDLRVRKVNKCSTIFKPVKRKLQFVVCRPNHNRLQTSHK